MNLSSAASPFSITLMAAVQACVLLLVPWPVYSPLVTQPGAARTRVVREPPARSGREYHVTPAGREQNDGSIVRPLDLATALSRRSPARPGDIIWLHGGTYRGAFVSQLSGTEAAPIIVRQFPGERATIDSRPSKRDALLALGQWTWFWGFEVTNSHRRRQSKETGSWPSDLFRGPGITAKGSYLKFINLVVHDTTDGFGIWEEAIGTEAYGNLVYHNGWQAADRGHGHGIYTQNGRATRVIRDNIIFQQFGHGIHAYGSERARLDNIVIEGNIAFNNGALAGDFARDILLGGGRIAQNPVVRENFTFGGAQTNIGYSAGCTNGTVRDNYFGGGFFLLVNCHPVMEGNVLVSTSDTTALEAQYPENTYYSEHPAGMVVRIRPNEYEAGRAHIVVYNWDSSAHVELDLRAACAAETDRFQLRDAQNYFGGAVAEGDCRDGRVRLPLTGLTGAAPVGAVPVPPTHTAPQFAAFVMLRALPESHAAQAPPVTRSRAIQP